MSLKSEAQQKNEDAVFAEFKKRKRCSVASLAEATGAKHSVIEASIDRLRERGVMIYLRGDSWCLDKEPAAGASKEFAFTSDAKGRHRFGFYSDQHICSKYARLDVGEDLYNRFTAAGIKTVLNAGNWIDGEARFNKHDLLVHGCDAQCRELAKVYPKRPGIVTYAVAGDDHEGWYNQQLGIDIGAYAENVMRESGRKDWVNLGYMEAFIDLKHKKTGASTKAVVMHPGGGSSYAVSYKVQKISEGFSGGDKPSAMFIGHYHKMSYNMTRNIHGIQCGCFTGNTRITTRGGEVAIRDIQVGDEVLTHLGRYRKVKTLFKRQHGGDFISINYGRLNRPDQTITATEEHPVLVERDGVRGWIRFDEVLTGDSVFVMSTDCVVTKEKIPYWMKMSRNANPMDLESVRDKLSETRGPRVRVRAGGSDGARDHMNNDIVPFCRSKQAEGWSIVPTGSIIIPDAIGFKDGKVVAFELERSTGRTLEYRKAKYDESHISEFIDAVEWVPLTHRQIQPRSWYEYDDESGFVKVKVLSVTRESQADRVRTNCSVYNFEVEEDNSYVAGRVVVHNCGEDQTPFMRKKGLDAHVGGGIAEFEQDPRTGALVACKVEFFNYFVKGYSNGRWSHSGDVVHAKRLG